jgi:hypothetical protein
VASLVEDYLVQRNLATNATASVRTVADKISEIASTTGTDPFECHVEGLGPNHGRIKSGRSVQAEEWPSAKDFHDALNAWANAETAAESTWKKMPDTFRSTLRPPGEPEENDDPSVYES